MPLKITPQPHWTEITLNEPPRNVLDRDLLNELVTTLDNLAAKNAPLILLNSLGRHFSTGYSIGDIPEEIFHRDATVRAGHPFEKAMTSLINYPSPIVATVQGDAYGGAVELLACTDLRVAAKGVRLGVPPVRLGLVYSHTGLRRLIRSFGSPMVREMLLIGEAISAERALNTGFFCRLVESDQLQETAEGILEGMSRGGPQALQGTRRILNLLEETEVLSVDSLEEIAKLRHEAWSGEEFVKARDAFINRLPSPFGS